MKDAERKYALLCGNYSLWSDPDLGWLVRQLDGYQDTHSLRTTDPSVALERACQIAGFGSYRKIGRYYGSLLNRN